MKRVPSIILSGCLLFSSTAWSTPVTPKLSDYVLSADAIRKLPQDQRLTYMVCGIL